MLETSAELVSTEQKEAILSFFDQTDWESFSVEDWQQIIDKFVGCVNFATTSREVAKVGGNYAIIGNNRNFFIGKTTIAEIVESVFDVLSEHLGVEPTKDLIVECIRGAIAKF